MPMKLPPNGQMARRKSAPHDPGQRHSCRRPGHPGHGRRRPWQRRRLQGGRCPGQGVVCGAAAGAVAGLAGSAGGHGPAHAAGAPDRACAPPESRCTSRTKPRQLMLQYQTSGAITCCSTGPEMVLEEHSMCTRWNGLQWAAVAAPPAVPGGRPAALETACQKRQTVRDRAAAAGPSARPGGPCNVHAS